jgi:Kef-type K+ transport system membrane component KefB
MRVSVTSLVVPLALGVATGLLVPSGMLGHPNQRAVFALLIGIAMSVSAIPVIAKTLLDMRLLDRELGQMVLAAGVVDGTLGWLLLSVVSALTTTGVQPLPLAEAVASLLGVLALAPLARPAVAFVLRAAGRSEGGDGMTAAAVVAMLLLAGGATQLLGLEAVLGAFLCGAVIRSTGEAGTAALAPVRTVVLSVLSPLYFATAGLRVDLTALVQPSVAVSAVAILAVAVAGKFAGAFVGATTSGLSRWEAVGLGAGLNSRGIVEVVVAGAGLRLGVLNGASYTAVILVAIATSVMAPPLLRLAVSHMDRAAERRAAAAAVSDGAGG